MSGTWHLIRRFSGSLRPGGPGAVDVDWVAGELSPREFALWAAMSGPDRRHSVAVARRVERAEGIGITRTVLAAALLHDVGKADARLRTVPRVGATLVGMATGRDPVRLRRWSEGRGIRARIGRYLLHPEIGAARLAEVGADPSVVRWAADHHRAPGSSGFDPEVERVLRAADDD